MKTVNSLCKMNQHITLKNTKILPNIVTTIIVIHTNIIIILLMINNLTFNVAHNKQSIKNLHKMIKIITIIIIIIMIKM